MVETLQNIDPNALAIVGIACRVPGADSFAALGRMLDEGREAITWLTPSEDEAPAVFRSDPRYVPAAAILGNVRDFDAAFFGFSLDEAIRLDPQQRLLLELSVEALDDAGSTRAPADIVTGTYVGTDPSAYLLQHLRATLASPVDPQWFPTVIANDKDFAAAQIAFRVGLKGPVVGVQGACATGLVALHVAAQALLAGECDRAVVGAAAIRLPQRCGYLAIPGALFSNDGHTRSYDAAGTGTVYGSGAVVVVVRRAVDAIKAGERIHAFIRGSAVHNQGAARPGFAAPSVEGHVNVLEEALAVAELDPYEIQYIEGNGTATPMGDAIEITAWKQVFGNHALPVGSIRSNLGHLQSAAGLAGLLKAVWALQTGRIPPTLHHSTPNAAFRGSRLVVPSESKPFPQSTDLSRRAIVTAFGVGGFHAAAVLQASSFASRVSAVPRHWQRISCWIDPPAMTVSPIVRTEAIPNTLEALQSRLSAFLPANAPPPSIDVPLSTLGLGSLDLVRFFAELEQSWPGLATASTTSFPSDLSLRTLYDALTNAPRPSAVTEAEPTEFLAMSRRFVRIPGGMIEVFEGGQGEPLLLLPPLGCKVNVWRPLVTSLGSSMRVIAPHPPGMGASRADGWDHGWIREVLRAMDISEPVHVAGWSYGGIVALSAVLDTPARFASLSLLCSTARAMPTPSFAALRELLERVESAVALETAGDAGLAEAFSGASLATIMDQARFLLTSDNSARLGELRLPVFLATGGRDAVLSSEHADLLRERLPLATSLRIEEAGHLLPVTHCNQLFTALEQFWRTTSLRS